MSIALAVIGGISAVSSIYGGREGAKAAEKAGKEAAALIRQETAESVRRAQAQNRQTEGATVATIGGSGVKMSGSTQNYYNAMVSENQSQVDWLQYSGDKRAEQAIKQGGYVSDQSKFSGFQGALSGIGMMVDSKAFDGSKPMTTSNQSPGLMGGGSKPNGFNGSLGVSGGNNLSGGGLLNSSW